MLNNELAKKTLYIRKAMNLNNRRFVYSDESEDSYKKTYVYLDTERRLFNFSQDVIGTISDCFILYAVACLGVADRVTIQLFLRNLKKNAPDLLIEDPTNDKNVQARIGALVKCGFLFCIEYAVYDYSSGAKEPDKMINRLYTIDKEANNLMNMKLTKCMPYNQWIQAKQLPELLGWASAAFVGTCISHDKNFQQYLDGAFRNRAIGTYYFPCELKFLINNSPAYISFIDSFLIHNSKSQTPYDFDEFRVRKVNAINNYLTYRSKKGPIYTVIVVEDNDDLVNIANLIVNTEILLDKLPQIYFTGEGIIRKAERIEDAFLQMSLTDEESSPFDFVAEKPSFIS